MLSRRKRVSKNSKSFYQWCIDNLSKEQVEEILSRWDYDKNVSIKDGKLTPKDVSFSSAMFDGKGYWFKCLDHPEHGSELKNISWFTNGQNGSITCNKCNMISITHPELVKYFVNIEDTLKYSYSSNKKVLMKCPDCGYANKVSIASLQRKFFHCPKCGDGVPYTEKFMFNVLNQLNIIFKTQLTKTTFEWCGNYRYDFYISNTSCVIETHGMQHYDKNQRFKMTLEEIQENDKNKELLAKANNVDNYIVIDCRKSELKWIKTNIMNSVLPRLLNFEEEAIDWCKCHEYALSSMVKDVCNVWNNEINNTTLIASKLKISKFTVIKYLKQGTKLGWCDYDPREETEKSLILRAIKVICLTTGEIFDSITSVSFKYNINGTNISTCCKNKAESAGKHPETGEKMVWMYYDDYIIKNQISGWYDDYLKIKNHSSKVVCSTTGDVFNTKEEARIKYNVDPSSVSKCCDNKLKTAGKDPVTGEKLTWMYYDEYIKSQDALIKILL